MISSPSQIFGSASAAKQIILVVEDEPGWYLLYKRLFEPAYQVLIATSYEVAIGPLMTQHPGLVITDLRLDDPLDPENYHGRHVLLLANLLSIPTIVVSGFLRDDIRADLTTLYGVSHVLDKVPQNDPPLSERIKFAVQDVMEKSQSQQFITQSIQAPGSDPARLLAQNHLKNIEAILDLINKCWQEVVGIINFNFEQRVRASGRTEENLEWLRARGSELKARVEALKARIIEAPPSQDVVTLMLTAQQECIRWKTDFSK